MNARRILVFGMACAAHQAGAQREPVRIPAVIVKAVMFRNLPTNDATRFTVETTPKGWPEALRPLHPAKAIGGGSFQGNLTTLYAYPRPIDGLALYKTMLEQRGYTLVPPLASEPNEFRGFVGHDAPPPMTTYCGESDAVIVRQVDSTRARRVIAVTRVTDWRPEGGCFNPQTRELRAPIVFPVLLPPPGVRADREGVFFNTRNEETSVRLDTLVSVNAVLAHYARELTAKGWQVVRNGDAGTLRVTATDAHGQEWHGILYVLTGVKDRLVVLRMMKDRD